MKTNRGKEESTKTLKLLGRTFISKLEDSQLKKTISCGNISRRPVSDSVQSVIDLVRAFVK